MRFEKIKSNMMKKTAERHEKTRRDYKEFFDHPLLFVALLSSGFLSMLAGLAIGLGAHMEGEILTYNADIPHLFFACLYAVLFPYFFEFGLANWLYKFLHREPENKIQLFTSGAMIIITFIGTAATAYSAMDVLVTAGGFFDSFQSIAPVVQRWIAFSLPTMFMINIAAGELYRQFTAEAVLKREATLELREAQVAADMEVSLAEMEAKKNIGIAAANAYTQRAQKEAPAIGNDKGNKAWDDFSQPMKAYAADSQQAELAPKGEAGSNQTPR